MSQQDIFTPRLHLRVPTAADFPHAQKAMEDHEVNKWITLAPWPYLPGSAEGFLIRKIKEVAEEKCCLWAITDKTTGEFLGLIEYAFESKTKAVRGFWLKRQAWNRGVMQEASKATLEYIFTQTSVEVVEACNHSCNDASRNVKLKTGFTFVEMREEEIRPGKVPDSRLEVYQLTKADWLAQHKN